MVSFRYPITESGRRIVLFDQIFGRRSVCVLLLSVIVVFFCFLYTHHGFTQARGVIVNRFIGNFQIRDRAMVS